MAKTIFITGTDTGVGKTVLTGLLLAHLRGTGVHALATKPFCTGPRADAELLFDLQDREVPLEIVNPFYFAQPVAPLVAVRAAKRAVSRNEVLRRIRSLRTACEVLLVEGAGGLFVPLGENYMIADLISALRCAVIVAARDQLGVINHTLLTVRALERLGIDSTTVVLMSAENPDASSRSNRRVLTERLEKHRVASVPLLAGNLRRAGVVRAHAAHQKKLLAHIVEETIFRTTFRSEITAEG